MEPDLKRMFEIKETEMTVPPTFPPGLRKRIGRQRLYIGGLIAAAAFALVLGGFAGARSLTSDEVLPPAEEDSNVSPFVDTWSSTDVEGWTRTMVIRPSGEDAYEITVQNHLAVVCSGSTSTLTGTGQLSGSTKLVIPSPEITCEDGSEPKTMDDLPPSLRDLTFEYDPESDILTNYSPLERRRVGTSDEIPYSGLNLVWRRDEAENRIGAVSGWIAYGNKGGIWARDLTSPDDPADRVRLSSEPGTPIGWSHDGSKLLVVRDARDPGGSPVCPACGHGSSATETDLFILNSDGTETRLTDPNEGATGGASFSPDATAVVYAGYGVEGPGSSSGIYVVDAEGGSPQLLLASGRETELREPSWSPDGSQIAYFSGLGDSGHSVRVIDSDGTGSRVVVENNETLAPGHVSGLQWSPDGRQLALGIETGLYLVGMDGPGLRLVTEDGGDPYWSPDGSLIAYTRPHSPGEGGSLEIVRLDNLQVQNFGAGGSGPWTAELRW